MLYIYINYLGIIKFHYTYINKTMTTMQKECRKCGKVQPHSEFSKCTKNKDGLQYQCRDCNRKSNHKFRTEINPEHHQKWQHNNMKRLCELVRNYRKADKNSLIYSIRNPDGETYIGMTQMHLSVRKLEHISNYRKASVGNNYAPLPLLHSSFTKWGVDNHTFEIVLDMGDTDRKQLAFIETSFIQAFQEINKSLNVRIK